MLQIPQSLLTLIESHGRSTYPYEGCGLLVGRVENGHNVVIEIHPLPNVWPEEAEKPERFRIDPAAWQAVELAAAENDLDVIGIFHSHPDHPPIASPRDLAWASWPGYSYLITRISPGEPAENRSWQLAEDRRAFREEELVISN